MRVILCFQHNLYRYCLCSSIRTRIYIYIVNYICARDPGIIIKEKYAFGPIAYFGSTHHNSQQIRTKICYVVILVFGVDLLLHIA